MVSYAIVHRVGVERFLNDAATSGLDGLIVPDLPVEESAGLLENATRRGLKLIQLITPTTPRERAIEIARSTTGFVYYVSVAGITGERKALPDAGGRSRGLAAHPDRITDLRRVRNQRSGPGSPARAGRRRLDRRQRDRAPLIAGDQPARARCPEIGQFVAEVAGAVVVALPRAVARTAHRFSGRLARVPRRHGLLTSHNPSKTCCPRFAS